jgi:Na+-translocating ferredoxin:NAD+ oxidoreductase RNF subunit RnfB
MSSVLNIALAVGFMAAFGLMLATVLVLANRRLAVYEDPRIDEVEDMLPHANCGACGTAGCRAFAEKLVAGELQPSGCTVNSTEMNQVIANYLGVELGSREKLVARLACAGGSHVAKRHGDYKGIDSCRAASLVAGGGKGCAWGCLGIADCKQVCDFNAIHMDEHDLPQVDNDLCTACGDCVDICPRDLFSLQPLSHRLWVACKNLEKGEAAEAECMVACNGCGRCAMDAPEQLISINNNLAVIDYSKNSLASKIAIERCPTGAIVWIEGKVQKGSSAVKIIRKSALPIE